MDEIQYNEIKPAITISGMLQLFKNRKLIIPDEGLAIRVLKNINYYRFSAYTLTYKNNNCYSEGTTFNNIYNLYEFDKQFRMRLMDFLERVEISFRTKISYYLAHKYGPLSYLDSNNFRNLKSHQDMLDKIRREINRSNERFVTHYIEKYNGLFPVWITVELMSFSQLSKMYENLKTEDKRNIALEYGHKYKLVENWLLLLSITRNICAHYGRLYNRRLPMEIRHTRKDKEIVGESNTLFSLIYAMLLLSDDFDIVDEFIKNISILISDYSEVKLEHLGFPEDWEKVLTRRSQERAGFLMSLNSTYHSKRETRC